MTQFLKDIFSNPDGSGSTKRTAGWVLLLCAITVGFSGLFFAPNIIFFDAVFFGFLTTGTSMFGLSSYDYSAFINRGEHKKDNTINNGPTGNQQ